MVITIQIWFEIAKIFICACTRAVNKNRYLPEYIASQSRSCCKIVFLFSLLQVPPFSCFPCTFLFFLAFFFPSSRKLKISILLLYWFHVLDIQSWLVSQISVSIYRLRIGSMMVVVQIAANEILFLMSSSRTEVFIYSIFMCSNMCRNTLWYVYVYIYILANSCLRRDFPRPPRAWRPGRHLWAPSAPPSGHPWRPFGQPPPSAAVKENKTKKFGAPLPPQISGASGAPGGFKNVNRSMRIPNMWLVLKSDNGKVGRLRHPWF